MRGSIPDLPEFGGVELPEQYSGGLCGIVVNRGFGVGDYPGSL